MSVLQTLKPSRAGGNGAAILIDHAAPSGSLMARVFPFPYDRDFLGTAVNLF